MSQKRSQNHSLMSQQGYTLIELMTALVLGLLLVAAAVQLLISGQASYRNQQNLGSIQDNGLYGMDYMARFVRLANYGNTGMIQDRNRLGGVLLSGNYIANDGGAEAGQVAGKVAGNLNDIKLDGVVATSTDLLTKNAIGDSVDPSNKSDQLTIAYRAPRSTYNCAGTKMEGPDLTNATLATQQGAVERYFIKKDGNDFGLYCTAVILPAGSMPTSIDGLGNNGVLISRNIEYLRILLNVRDSAGKYRTLSTSDYLALGLSDYQGSSVKIRPAIIGVQIGMLVRSTQTLGTSSPAPSSYTVLDKVVTIPAGAARNYQRMVYTTSVSLRNGLGALP